MLQIVLGKVSVCVHVQRQAETRNKKAQCDPGKMGKAREFGGLFLAKEAWDTKILLLLFLVLLCSEKQDFVHSFKKNKTA